MAIKIYLSPALHGADNPTACPFPCSENTHCGQYMDIVEKRLKALGFSVLRGGPSTGTPAMYARVAQSNSFGADLHYVAHTNAGGGRYSMTMCWNDEESREKADILHRYRQSVKSHVVRTNTALYEIRATRAICLYDELFFHDNAEDCAWFHQGGMEKMAEETVQAICEMFGVAYFPETPPKPDEPTVPETPKGVALYREPLYVSASAVRAVGTLTGTYYRWDDQVVRGRVRMTVSPDRRGKVGEVTGWIDEKAVK